MARDIHSFKYKSIFSAFAKVVSGNEDTPKLATASIKELTKLFKPEISDIIENNPDILAIASNLILASHINLNGDCVLLDDLLKIYENFKFKPIDLQHNKENIVGCIYEAGFSIFPSSKIITVKEASESRVPVQLVIGAFLWKLVDRNLCAFLIDASNEQSENFGKISTSFELLFDDYDIAIGHNGNTNINDATIIKKDNPLFEKYDKILICNEGPGKLGNDIIGRILIGEIMPVGAGLVTKPASGLKGILAINDKSELSDKPAKAEPNKDGNVELPNNDVNTPKTNHERLEPENTNNFLKNAPQSTTAIEFNKKIDDLNEKNINITKTSVKANINNKISKKMSIKINDIKEFESLWPELQKQEALASFSSVREFIEAELAKVSENFTKQIIEKENMLKAVEANKVEAEKKAKELQDAVDKLNKHVEELKAEESVRKAGEKFNERMATVDDTFDLDQDERAMLASEVKDMSCDCEADDMAYSAWLDKHKKLMKEKTKEFKKDQEVKAKAAKKDMEDKFAKAGVKVVLDETTLNVKEVIASVIEDKTQSNVPNTVVPSTTETLTQQMKRVFGAGLTINGVTADEIVKNNK